MRKVQDLSEVSTEFVTGVDEDGSLQLENITVFTNAHSPESKTDCFQLFLAHEQMIDGQPVMWRGRDLLLSYYFGLCAKERESSGAAFFRSIADKLYQREPLTGAELIHARMHCEMVMINSMLNRGKRMEKDFLLRHFVVAVWARLRPDKSVESAIEDLPPELKLQLKNAGYKIGDTDSLRRQFDRVDEKFNDGQATAEHSAARKEFFAKKRTTNNQGDVTE